MTVEVFEREAARYEAWYSTPRGRRVDAAERELLDWLLTELPPSRTVLEVGCGTGHFTAWLAREARVAIGLDHSPAMLEEARRRVPALPLIFADARHLPLEDGSVDAAVFVTTLEFLEDPAAALAEAVRVARHAVAVVALNRWSAGGFSRRGGRQRRSPVLGRARDWSRRSLHRALVRAAGRRLARVRWASSLFPDGLWRLRLPLGTGGEVIGMVARLAAPDCSRPSLSGSSPSGGPRAVGATLA